MNDKDRSNSRFYLAQDQIKGLSVRRKGSLDYCQLEPGLVSISPEGCSFEREGGQEFRQSESLEFQFDLSDRTVKMEGTVTAVNSWTPWDDNYGDKTFHRYQANFEGEMESNAFGCMAGCRKRTSG